MVLYAVSGDTSKLTMTELIPNSVDAAKEKHVPFVSEEGNKLVVKVGDVEHPMLSEHYIQWIAAEGEDGVKITYLMPNDKPVASFCNKDKWIKRVYAYCNLHGLWVKEL